MDSIVVYDNNQNPILIKQNMFYKKGYMYNIRFTRNSNVYSYHMNNVEVVESIKNYNIDNKIIKLDGFLVDCDKIDLLETDSNKYFYLNNNLYSTNRISIEELVDINCDVFSYFKDVSAFLKIEDKSFLRNEYEKLDKLSSKAIITKYLKINKKDLKKYKLPKLIFPFGINSSQYESVVNALKNQASVIQGPPGTGKTQTILNIIANLIVNDKNIQVVSNNNSAIKNISDKLSSEKYDLGFLVAMLGNYDNKMEFISSQNSYPDSLESWKEFSDNFSSYLSNITDILENIETLFKSREELEKAKEEYSSYLLEYEHFKKSNIDCKTLNLKASSDKILSLLVILNEKKEISFFRKLKAVLFDKIGSFSFYKENNSDILNTLYNSYYQIVLKNLKIKIEDLEKKLINCDEKTLIKNLQEDSLKYLKGFLYKKYKNKKQRYKIKYLSELNDERHSKLLLEEYPIILSTTSSASKSLSSDIIYDYVIFDEASQVDVVSGVLCLSKAKNIVVVGDTKQLPNVVDSTTLEKVINLEKNYNIDSSYLFSKHSFLTSILGVFNNVCQTLLKEHYRCNSQIINFCNKSFYDNCLIIMSNKESKDSLKVVTTVKGNHRFQNINLREAQVIKELVDDLVNTYDDIGVIAPYKDQVKLIKETLNNSSIKVDTVHKFQGRENNVIILSTVYNNEYDCSFVNDKQLLNVAISRAKNKLILVTNGNEFDKQNYITDLINYITYNNGEVSKSNICSIFDLLYRQYNLKRKDYLLNKKKVSKFDSENLMYNLILKILENYPKLDVINNYPMNKLVNFDNNDFTKREKEFALNPLTHNDFLIYNTITKKAVLAIEVDGMYHKLDDKQKERDEVKDLILDKIKLKHLRLSTKGSNEEEKIINYLDEIVS